MTPVCVQTGCANGCNDKEQKLNGRRLNAAFEPPCLALETPAPALAEYESPDDHSECVIWISEDGQQAILLSGGGLLSQRSVARRALRRAYPSL